MLCACRCIAEDHPPSDRVPRDRRHPAEHPGGRACACSEAEPRATESRQPRPVRRGPARAGGSSRAGQPSLGNSGRLGESGQAYNAITRPMAGSVARRRGLPGAPAESRWRDASQTRKRAAHLAVYTRDGALVGAADDVPQSRRGQNGWSRRVFSWAATREGRDVLECVQLGSLGVASAVRATERPTGLVRLRGLGRT